MDQKILLVGAGKMAIEYAKVLKAQNVPFEVIGRGEASASEFEKQIGVSVIRGGLEAVKTETLRGKKAIVAVSVEALAKTTTALMEAQVSDILLEKPAGLNAKEVGEVAKAAHLGGARLSVAYNRRFYASTQKARELIAEDGGALSFVFEFTEWAHVIEPLPLSKETKENWLLANSSHVIDLAFFLGGKPKEIEARTSKSGALPWHPRAAIYSGSGISETGALFSYNANWLSAGRWGVEILTKNRRLILRPLEKLFEQKKGEIEIKEILLDDELDKKFKPGVYREVEEFLSGKKGFLPTVKEQASFATLVEKIGQCE